MSTDGLGGTASALDPNGVQQNLIVNIAESQTVAVKAEKHMALVVIDQ